MPASHTRSGLRRKRIASTSARSMLRPASFWDALISSLLGNHIADRIGRRGLSAPAPCGRSPEDIFGKMKDGFLAMNDELVRFSAN